MKITAISKSLLSITLLGATLLLSHVAAASAQTTQPVFMTVQDAEGGVTRHVPQGGTIVIVGLDSSSDLYTDADYSTPIPEYKFALNTSEALGGWHIKNLKTSVTVNGETFAPTEGVLSYSRALLQYNTPAFDQPITAENRYNVWTTFTFKASAPGLTAVVISKGDNIINKVKYIFKIQVDGSTLPVGSDSKI